MILAVLLQIISASRQSLQDDSAGEVWQRWWFRESGGWLSKGLLQFQMPQIVQIACSPWIW